MARPTARLKSSTWASTSASTIIGINPESARRGTAKAAGGQGGGVPGPDPQGLQGGEDDGPARLPRQEGGRHGGVGPVNLPVTRLFVEEIILECRQKHITKVDLLGFEFEMGLFPNVLDEAKAKGIDIQPKYIPAEVFDKRAVEQDQVVFHDVAAIEVQPIVKGNCVAVELTDFSVFYSQDSAKAATESTQREGEPDRRREGADREGDEGQERDCDHGPADKAMDRLGRLLGGRFRFREQARDHPRAEGGRSERRRTCRAWRRRNIWRSGKRSGRATSFSRTSGRAFARRRTARWN